jgi:hypothetical protein
MSETSPAETIARAARLAGDAFAACVATSVAASSTKASAAQLKAFEAVTRMVLDDCASELEAALVEHAPQYTPQRAHELAADFLVAWGENVAEEAPAILDGDAARLAQLEMARGNLIAQLVEGATAPRPHLVAVAGGRGRK